MNLAEKMETWRILHSQAVALEDEIREEVLQLGKSQRVGQVLARYTSGRGSYDYPKITEAARKAYEAIGPEALAKFDETVAALTKKIVTVDHRAICERVGASEDLKAQFYTPGKPSVSLAIVEEGVNA